MYKVKDNAEAQLKFGISSVTKTIILKDNEGRKFPETPFLAVLNHRNQEWKILKSEKIEVQSINWDQFGIQRGVDGDVPTDFSANDRISLFILAKHIQELQEAVEKKADKEEFDAVATRTSTLEEKVKKTEEKVEKLEEGSVPEFIGKTLTVGESYQNWDILYDDRGTARKKIISHSFNLGISFSEGNRNIGEFGFTPDLPIKIEIEELKMESADAYIVFGRRYFTSKNDVDNNPNDVYWKILVGQIPENTNITIPSADRVYVSIVSQFQSYNKVFTCKSAKIIQDKKPEWPAYYPREVKGVGQKVICTLVGIHSDNKFVTKETEIIEINKNIVGNASWTWIAPRDWLLFFQYTSSDHSRFNATAYINGSDVRKYALYWSQYMNNYMRDWIWILKVKKWETYTLTTVVEDYRYKSSLTLRYFISL